MKCVHNLTENKKIDDKEKTKIINESINLAIINKLLKKNLITEKQFFIIKNEIRTFL